MCVNGSHICVLTGMGWSGNPQVLLALHWELVSGRTGCEGCNKGGCGERWFEGIFRLTGRILAGPFKEPSGETCRLLSGSVWELRTQICVRDELSLVPERDLSPYLSNCVPYSSFHQSFSFYSSVTVCFYSAWKADLFILLRYNSPWLIQLQLHTNCVCRSFHIRCIS